MLALNLRFSRLGEAALIYVTPPISDVPIFPWTVPTPDQIDRPIDVLACRGEFEPATFTVFATRDLKQVRVQVSEFVGEKQARLDPSIVDVHQVLCWYQAGATGVFRQSRALLPELLIRNGGLITVDPAARENRLNFTGYPQDSPQLVPADVPAFESKQFWLTFHVPGDAAPGRYRATVRVSAGSRLLKQVPLTLTVHDFDLADSTLQYSLYYRLRFTDKRPHDAVLKQMAAEIRNQVEHGINMPSTYVGGGAFKPGGPAFEKLEALTRIYRSLGLKDHPLILVTTSVGTQSTPEQLEAIRSMVRKFVAFGREHGYSDVYFQGIDEASGERLRAERQSFAAVNEAGGKVFVACGADYFDIIGDLLNMPVVGGPLRPELARKVRPRGYKIMSYANPQAGVEKPETYRRNYGIRLWAAGYDGGFDYEYQSNEHDPGKAYDDFSGKRYRNHTMAYPTGDKPIDTIQWEGWREGVDDVRYLTTLLKILEELESKQQKPKQTAAVRAWLKTIDGRGNLDELRRQIVQRIKELRAR